MEQVAATEECFSVEVDEIVAHSEEVETSVEQNATDVPSAVEVSSSLPQPEPQPLAQPVAQPVYNIPTLIASPGPLMQVVTLQTVQQPCSPQAGLTNTLRNIRLIAIQPKLPLNGVNGRLQSISLQQPHKTDVKIQPQVVDTNEARKVAVTNFYSKLKTSPAVLAPKNSHQQISNQQVKPKRLSTTKQSGPPKKTQQPFVKPSPSFYKEQQREREMKEFPHLSEELQRGLRILLDLTTSLHHSTTWPFMERVDPVKDGAPDYDQVIEKPMWLNKIKEKFRKNEYSSVKDFVNDMRLLFENCYRYNGPNHPVTKKALRFEQSFEQKIALLPTDLRELCILSETEDERKARPTSSEAYFSILLHRVRHEREKREQVAKEKKAEEQRLRREEKERQRALWAERMMNPEVKSQMKCMWEIPQLGHFLHLARGALHIGEIAQYELEHMFLMPEASVLLATLMTSLLSSPNQRIKLAESPPTPYSVWSSRLNNRVAEWYRAYNREGRQFVKVHELLGIEPMFWRVCGDSNPLDGSKRYHQLSFLKRVWVFKGLCDSVAHSHKTVQEAMAEEEGPESRQVTLGMDADGYTYLHFPAVSGSDIRVYRQKHWDVESDPIWGPIVAERKAEEEERILEEERKAAELKRLKRASASAKRTPARKSQSPAKRKQGARTPSQSTPVPQRKRPVPEERPQRIGTRISPRTLQRQTGLTSYKDSSSSGSESSEKNEEEDESEDEELSDTEKNVSKVSNSEIRETVTRSTQRKRGRGRGGRNRKRPVKKKLQKIKEEPEEEVVSDNLLEEVTETDAKVMPPQSRDIENNEDSALAIPVQTETADTPDTTQKNLSSRKANNVIHVNGEVDVKKESAPPENIKSEDVSETENNGKEESTEDKHTTSLDSDQPLLSTQRFTVSQLIKKISAEQKEENTETDIDNRLTEAGSNDDNNLAELEKPNKPPEEEEFHDDLDPERSTYDPFVFELIISSVEELQEWINCFSDHSTNEEEDEEPRKPRPRCEIKLRERLQSLLDEAKPLAADQQQANQKICQQLWKEWERYRSSSEKTSASSKTDEDSDHIQENEQSDSEVDEMDESMTESDGDNGPRQSRRLRVKRSRQTAIDSHTGSTRSSSPADEELPSKQARRGTYGYDPAWDSDASAEPLGRRRTNFVPEMKTPEYWVGRRVTRATAAFAEPDFSEESTSNPSSEQQSQTEEGSQQSTQPDEAPISDKPTISPAKTEQLIDQLRQLRRQQAMLSSNDPRPSTKTRSVTPENGAPSVFLPSKDGQSLVRITNPKAAELLSRLKTNRQTTPLPDTSTGQAPRKIFIQQRPPVPADGGVPGPPISIDITQLIAQAAEKGMIVSHEPRSLSMDLGQHGNFLVSAQMTPQGPKVLTASPLPKKVVKNPLVSPPATMNSNCSTEPISNSAVSDVMARSGKPVASATSTSMSRSEQSEPLGNPQNHLQSPDSSVTKSDAGAVIVPSTKQVFVNDPRQNNIISQDILQTVAGPEAIGSKLTIIKEGNTKVLTLILANGEIRRLTNSQVQQIQSAVRNKTKVASEVACSPSSAS